LALGVLAFQVLASVKRRWRRLAPGALLTASFALAGCSSQIADLTPADAQPRPREAGTYLPVHDIPPARDEAGAISPEQRAKIEAELMAARDRQATAAKDAK
jgi:hypothetical protein